MEHPLRWKFDLVEVSLIIVVVALASWCLGSAFRGYVPYSEQTTRAEQAELTRRYGPQHYSEHDEEWIARDFFETAAAAFSLTSAPATIAISVTRSPWRLRWDGLASPWILS